MRTIVMAAAVVVAATLTAALPAPVSAAEPPAAGGAVTADLDGIPIAAAEIADWHCHDTEFPVVHCFVTAAELGAAIVPAEASSKSADAVDGGSALDAVTYVIVYAQPTYSGASLAISQDYDTLAVVGWNDRIRSYRAVNGELGRFWTDWFGGGSKLDFCCNVNAPSLSATFDAQITSVYRR